MINRRRVSLKFKSIHHILFKACQFSEVKCSQVLIIASVGPIDPSLKIQLDKDPYFRLAIIYITNYANINRLGCHPYGFYFKQIRFDKDADVDQWPNRIEQNRIRYYL